MVAITGVLTPAWTKPIAMPMLAPIETSFQTVLNGGFMPRMVQPMSPVTITSSFLKPARRTAWLIAMKVPRCGQPAQTVIGRAAASFSASE